MIQDFWARVSTMWLLGEFGILLFCSPGFWDVGGLLRALSFPGAGRLVNPITRVRGGHGRQEAYRRSWLLILLLFLCCLSVFLFSGQRATRTNCGEEEVVDLRACVRGCDRPQGRVGLSGDVRSAFLLSS